jgi:MFS family permease
MIKQIKLGMKLIKYSYGAVMSVFGTAISLAIGILLYVFPYPSQSASSFSMMGCFMIVAAGLWPFQMICTLSVPHIVQTSARKKELQTAVPALASFFLNLFDYLLVVVLQLLPVTANSSDAQMKNNLLITGIFIFLISLYGGGAYKYFFTSTVLLMLVCMAGGAWIGMSGVLGNSLLPFLFGLSYPAAFLIGLGCIAAGAVIQYGLTLLLYKKPLSKAAQFQAIQKIL